MKNLLIILLSILSLFLYVDKKNLKKQNAELCDNQNRLTIELSEVKNYMQYFEIYTNIFESKYCKVKIDSTINFKMDSITNYIIQSNK
jgi:heme/copper-type cytochrome/quinol oxidase subunit 2